MLKLLTIAANVSVLIWMVVLLSIKNGPRNEELILVGLIIVGAGLSVWNAVAEKGGRFIPAQSWLGLELEARKAILRRKIKQASP